MISLIHKSKSFSEDVACGRVQSDGKLVATPSLMMRHRKSKLRPVYTCRTRARDENCTSYILVAITVRFVGAISRRFRIGMFETSCNLTVIWEKLQQILLIAHE